MGAVSKSPLKQANDAHNGPGPDGQRVMARDTDAYSQAQFAKPAVPRSQWQPSDQEKRASGELPTRCGCTKLTVEQHEAVRWYILSIQHNTIRVELLKDADAIALIRKAVSTLHHVRLRYFLYLHPGW